MLFKIMQEEEGIYKNNEKKQRFTIKVLLLAIALFIYWVILIFVYEKDKKYVTAYTGEDELLKKYNKEEFHIRHALTVEAVMRYFAKQKGYDEDFWGIVRFIA